VLETTLAGAVLLAVCAIDLGATTYDGALVTTLLPPDLIFATPLGLRAAIDLAGLALGGGLFIVPAFAAVQAWSDANYRARTVAAVNVLNAAFMTGATVLVALLQNFGVTVPMLFLGIGVTTFLVAAAIWKTMPTNLSSPGWSR
jgi:acyl-[acyl-carrier-protein]-phospholipid O-acyltransferase/long-chain-fatty-acid--[acyl-carrier-protein] ligase